MSTSRRRDPAVLLMAGITCRCQVRTMQRSRPRPQNRTYDASAEGLFHSCIPETTNNQPRKPTFRAARSSVITLFCPSPILLAWFSHLTGVRAC